MNEGHVTHQLAAILYADVSGYSRLTELDEAGTHRQLSTSLNLSNFAHRTIRGGAEDIRDRDGLALRGLTWASTPARPLRRGPAVSLRWR